MVPFATVILTLLGYLFSLISFNGSNNNDNDDDDDGNIVEALELSATVIGRNSPCEIMEEVFRVKKTVLKGSSSCTCIVKFFFRNDI